MTIQIQCDEKEVCISEKNYWSILMWFGLKERVEGRKSLYITWLTKGRVPVLQQNEIIATG